MGHGVFKSSVNKVRMARIFEMKMINNNSESSDEGKKDPVNLVSEVVLRINDEIKCNRATSFARYESSKSIVINSTSHISIYEVPPNLREVHESAFDPKLISIGPFHYKNKKFEAMESHKLRFLSRLLNQFNKISIAEHVDNRSSRELEQIHPQVLSHSGHDSKLEQLASAMRDLEVKARACYSETFDHIDSLDFVDMMIRDGCFVVELLRLFAKGGDHKQENDVHDPLFSARWIVPNLQRDLLLFENQLPLIVLTTIFDLTNSENGKDISDNLTLLALKFFDPLMPKQKTDKCSSSKGPKKEPLAAAGLSADHQNTDHLLGVFHDSFVSSLKRKKSLSHPSEGDKNLAAVRHNGGADDPRHYEPAVHLKCEPVQLIHSVRVLEEAGIEFKKRENDHELLDIRYRKGVLEIPPLLIDDQTGPVLLNFLAYEQCAGHLDPYFTHYVLFFDSLVNSSKDVEILHYKDIIRHSLGSDEEVAAFFNKLCKEIVHEVDNCYLSQVLEDVNKYYGTNWHQWRAELTHVYFRNPWTIFALSASAFLIIITTIQTIFTILPYAFPSP